MAGMYPWFKRRFKSFDLLPDYFRSAALHWQDVLWGASVLAIGFAVWWFLGNPSPRIIGLYLVSAMFVAGYYVWRADHVRLMPKLTLGDVRAVHTPTFTPAGLPGAERLVAQLEVANPTDAALTNCRGHLLRVLQWTNDQWEPTAVDERLNLLWSTVDEPTITLYAKTEHQLCVFRIDNDDNPRIGLWASPQQLRMAAVFEHPDPATLFRFDISVTADECLAVNISLKVAMGAQWDEPVVEPLV
jgi:hypothetical protein